MFGTCLQYQEGGMFSMWKIEVLSSCLDEFSLCLKIMSAQKCCGLQSEKVQGLGKIAAKPILWMSLAVAIVNTIYIFRC